ncbi:protein kinase domain-containing protein [Aquisphaera insulae]|uniref:protein kinase domain-containing protein n=1 Tax=Aquisphaera insulae TaxID=2712864 RepID=UPI0013EC95C3|nr:protein kinase [Aquisphaera insulae]
MTLRLEADAEPVTGYRLVRKLGEGGVGEAWEAIAPGGVRVALKFIRLGSALARPEMRSLDFIRDIRHPHLLDIQFIVQVDDRLVVAMPLCDKCLTDRLTECRREGLSGLPPDELIGYMGEMAAAIDFLNEPRHRAADGTLVGIQHRDIKPHNVFLVGGSTRLADFGLAKVVKDGLEDHSGCMTPHYAAPELLEGKISNRSDQYSLAITYVQLRTGQLPFRGPVADVMLGHLRDEPDLFGLPVGERAVVARALAKKPDDRWPSCREFVRDLERADRDRARRRRQEDLAEPTVAPGVDLTWSPKPPSTHPAAVSTAVKETPDPRPVAAADWKGHEPAPRHRLGRAIGLAAALAVVGLLAVLAVPLATRWSSLKREQARPDAGGPAPEPLAGAAESPSSPPPSLNLVMAKEEAKPGSPPHHEETGGRGSTEPQRVTPGPDSKPAPKPAADPNLPVKARAFLKAQCHRCHGVRFEVPGYDVLDRDGLVAKRGEGQKPYVTPGKPEDSELWKRLGEDRDMPPSGPLPDDTERAMIRDWIASGATFPRDGRRKPVSDADILGTIVGHLRRLDPAERPRWRYFTLASLHNNPGVPDEELRLARAGISKLLNSLSSRRKMAVPEALGPEQAVLAIDVTALGWDAREIWDQILKRYPYGLSYRNRPSGDPLRPLAIELEELVGEDAGPPDVRADWFLDAAARPALYQAILDIPATADKLEARLGVDVRRDFLSDQLRRAGFTTSGVSSQNRLADRHNLASGYYWKSYDFRNTDGTGNVFRYPLGPAFADNPYPRLAFEHAGGEIIYSLPNGLQAYMLVDAKGDRIDSGPAEVVGDSMRTSGTTLIVAGLSCMACHRDGVIRFQDRLRAGTAAAGSAREKVERLVPAKAEWDKILAGDEALFLAAAEQATGPLLRVGADEGKPVRDFPEPITAIARRYQKDMGADAVAAELGMADSKGLLDRIRDNPALGKLGLGVLTDGGTLKRSEWDSLKDRTLSIFHEVNLQIRRGTPQRRY